MIVSGTMQSVFKAYADAVPIKKKITDNPAAAVREEKDEVVLSQQAQSFHQVLQRAKEQSDVRMERVSALSQRIEAGDYRLDARDIAEKLLSFRY